MGGPPPASSVQYLTKTKRSERSLELFCIFALTFAALCLYCFNLGDMPLRDWDEATVAQVAKEISRHSPEALHWLFPSLNGEPYLNKPPLMHNLIAEAFRLWGVNEFAARIPGAFLTALSVPVLYGLARELFSLRLPALLTALTYLTMLPVVRHGRLAMLDGPVLCFGIMTLWAVLRCRRDLRWSLVVGLSIALVGLTKGIMMAGLWGAIAFAFLLWDTPRLLLSFYGLLGFILGSLPLWAWYGAQWIHYQDLFISTNLWSQSFSRIFNEV
ncbi:MAG: phospholipid carrier-dependent glycosyltransferase, partial [Synechococcaceae cyanobacterium RL_1_2]|nr:phospholipid carrier-dependent glycosyltransferase [Synechococcaceae cyanobacterium RL_1_2]